MDIVSSLTSKNIIDEVVAGRIASQVASGASIEASILAENVSEDIVRDAYAEFYSVPSFKPETEMRIAEDVLRYIPEESARHYNIIPLKYEDDVLLIGTNDPEDLQIREVLNFISTKNNTPYKLVFVLQKDLSKILTAYESLTGEVGEALTSLETD